MDFGPKVSTVPNLGHIIDLEGATISKHVFSRIIRIMPRVHKEKRENLRFYCSESIIDNYRSQLSSRNISLGDCSLLGNEPLLAFGIPIISSPMIPEDLDAFGESKGWTDCTQIWLTICGNLRVEIDHYNRIVIVIKDPNALVIGHSIKV